MMRRVGPDYTIPASRPVILVDEPGKAVTRPIGWMAASLTAVLMHAGIVYYATRETSDIELPPPSEPAAVMIEMSPDVQQAYSKSDETVGKPMQERADETAPPPDAPKPEPLPRVEPSPTEAVAPLPPKPPEPPRIKDKPPPEKVPPKHKKPSKKMAARSAPKTANAPRSEHHATRTSAASAGASSNPAAIADWKGQFAAQINRVKHYPDGAFGSGSPVVRVSISTSGSVSSAVLLASSGSSDIDSEAIAAVHRAAPFPPPPPGLVSVTFRMNFSRR